jgi:hypothetical protein
MACCKNHPQMAAEGRCAGCAEDYCATCLVELHNQKYCGSCKFMALEGKVPTAVAAAREARERPLPTANQAFATGLVGFIFGTIGCFYIVGIVCGITAISNGIRAKRDSGGFPSRMARFKSTAGIVFGSLGILMNVLNLAALAMRSGR